VKHIQELLVEIGLERERVRMFNLSSAMGAQFASAAREISEQVAALGANPLRRDAMEGES
jgi:F420-non-reducing hydrogenase iron-sulfur subunit